MVLAESEIDQFGASMPLSPKELAYQAIQSASDSSTDLVTTNGTSPSPTTAPKNILDEVLPMEEAIREIMYLEE